MGLKYDLNTKPMNFYDHTANLRLFLSVITLLQLMNHSHLICVYLCVFHFSGQFDLYKLHRLNIIVSCNIR